MARACGEPFLASISLAIRSTALFFFRGLLEQRHSYFHCMVLIVVYYSFYLALFIQQFQVVCSMDITAEINQFLETDFPQVRSTVELVEHRYARVRHPLTKDDLRPGGTVSGPTMFAVADLALYVAILGEIGLVPLAVTTNLNINFLYKPAANKDLIVECRLIKVGKGLIMGDVFIYSEGLEQPVAHATGTYSIPPKRA